MSTRKALKLLAMASAALCAHPALADVKAGVDAWSRGDYGAAVSEWQAPAERGDPDALFNLAQAYKLGRGVKTDLRKAEELFGRAAAKGHLQAADLYGLLLFQRGERQQAMPYVIAAAGRGEPRALYLLGVAHFNGDFVEKDWVRAYALASLARQNGVEQASAALAQMDRYIPLDQRQRGAALAPELASQAEATRARQFAASDLGANVETTPVARPSRPVAKPRSGPAATASTAAEVAGRVADGGPGAAGADYARPQVARPAPRPSPAPLAAAKPAPRPTAAASAATAAAPAGRWKVQLGAFSVRGNAEALWNRVRDRAELAGRQRELVRAGSITRLLAGGFATRQEAADACAKLTAAGFDCIVPRN